jgi:hypothetical protein
MSISLMSIPFLTVRVAYGLSLSFIASNSPFIRGRTNVIASAFLQYLMESIVTTLFLYAGIAGEQLQKLWGIDS